MLPVEATRALVENELPGARAWADRRGIPPLAWNPETLELRAVLTQPGTAERFYLRGRFDDYSTLPPMWDFSDATYAAGPTAALYPRPTRSPSPNGGSMFIQYNGHPLICAPFNRAAHVNAGGPHNQWTLADWMRVGGEWVEAHTIGDMLAAIDWHFQLTTGRLV
jgi:hypothetical protein